MRYELLVGLRYTRARRRNRFIGINSLVSMIGIMVGVWALIVVLSVMNGFQKEVRTRILGVASHVQITSINNRLKDWQPIAAMAAKHEHVIATAPFVQAQAMLSAGSAGRGGLGGGLLPGQGEKGARPCPPMKKGSLQGPKPRGIWVVLRIRLPPGPQVA